MLLLTIHLGKASNIYSSEKALTANEILAKVEEITGCPKQHFYIVHNGRPQYGSDICRNGTANIIPRLCGGKGGFGSMLRAIGAQIEKTTNREACRDLSGRRLRDINEEKRLKAWIDKQGTRDEEAVERKKKKLQRLCAQPKHEFKDQNYEQERSSLTEKVSDAVEQGFKSAMASSSGLKRKSEDEGLKRGKKKLSLGLDSDIDSDELGSSDSEEDGDETKSRNSKMLETGVSRDLDGNGDSGNFTEENAGRSKTDEEEHKEAQTDSGENSSSGQEEETKKGSEDYEEKEDAPGMKSNCEKMAAAV